MDVRRFLKGAVIRIEALISEKKNNNNQRGDAPRKGTLIGRKALNQITAVNVLCGIFN